MVPSTPPDMKKFGTPDSSEKMIAIPGGRWWAQEVRQEEGYGRFKVSKSYMETA